MTFGAAVGQTPGFNSTIDFDTRTPGTRGNVIGGDASGLWFDDGFVSKTYFKDLITDTEGAADYARLAQSNTFSAGTTQTLIGAVGSQIKLTTTSVPVSFINAGSWRRNKYNFTSDYSRAYDLADTTLTLSNDGFDAYSAPGPGTYTQEAARLNVYVDGQVLEMGATVDGRHAIAKGEGAYAEGYGVAIGKNASVYTEGIALGNSVTTSGVSILTGETGWSRSGGVALGSGAQANAAGLAWGTDAIASIPSDGYGRSIALGNDAVSTGSYATAIGLACKALGYASHVHSDTSTATALTAFIGGGGHNQILNKGTDIAGANSGGDGPDSAIVGSYLCRVWANKGFITSSQESVVNGDRSSIIGSYLAGISGAHDYSTLINVWNDSYTTATTGDNQVLIGTAAHPQAVTINGTPDASNTYALDVNGTARVTGTISGPGSGITALNASSLASGTVPDARISSTIARDNEFTMLPLDGLGFYCRMRSNSSASVADVITATAPTVNGTPAAAGFLADSGGRPSVGYCLTFDGTNDYLNYGNICDITTNDFSVGAWIKWTNTTSVMAVIGKENTNMWRVLANGSGTGSVSFETYDGTTYDNFVSTGVTLNDGLWHHVFFTWTQSSKVKRIYVDGALNRTSSALATAAGYGNTGNLQIGYYAARNYFNGTLDEMMIFNGMALNAQQVASLYHFGTVLPD